MWPAPPLPAPAAPAPKPEVIPETPQELAARLEREAHEDARGTAIKIAMLGAALLAVGVASPE
eukprot:scaffold651457_cov45-Prasinocladus_malaysianus.AAC.1